MDFTFLGKYYDFFIQGTLMTILIALITVFGGTVLGLFLSILKMSKSIFSFIAKIYIEFFRCTPIMIQLFLIYFGPSVIGIDLDKFAAAVIALSLNSGAYVAEIIRAGIQAVDKGQMEAARSLGMSKGTAMKEIIIPQAFKNILPALVNEFITVIKESSVAYVIGVTELMSKVNTVIGKTFRPFEPLIVASLIYFILTFSLSKLLSILERRMKTSDGEHTDNRNKRFAQIFWKA